MCNAIPDCAICARSLAIWEAARIAAENNEPSPWSERDEQQISQIAETYDYETGWYRPLRRTR